MDLKGIAIVYDESKEFFLITGGELSEIDLKGYEGVLIRKTIYKAVHRGLLQSLVFWLLKRWSRVDVTDFAEIRQ
jgi:hypothetical protein